MFRAGTQKRATASDSSGQNHRRDRSHHLPDGVFDIPDLLLYPLQRLLLGYVHLRRSEMRDQNTKYIYE